MALPDVDALKRVLKIEHAAEDTLLAQLRAQALGLIAKFIGCPIEAIPTTFFDEAGTQRFGSSGPRSLLIAQTPVDAASAVITDASGTVLDLADLRIDVESGVVRYVDGISRFINGPYRIEIDVGLDVRDRYEDDDEPVVALALVDTVSDLYARRTPSLRSESSSGVSRSFGGEGLPARVMDALLLLRRPQ